MAPGYDQEWRLNKHQLLGSTEVHLEVASQELKAILECSMFNPKGTQRGNALVKLSF